MNSEQKQYRTSVPLVPSNYHLHLGVGGLCASLRGLLVGVRWSGLGWGSRGSPGQRSGGSAIRAGITAGERVLGGVRAEQGTPAVLSPRGQNKINHKTYL